jgi:hypothetical protein
MRLGEAAARVGFEGCSKGGDYPKMAAMVVRIPAVFGKWTKGGLR